MKVTFVVPNYAPSRGGAQELVRRVAEGLVVRGHEVTVLTTDALRSPTAREPGHIDAATEVIDGVEVRRFATPGVLFGLLRLARLARVRIRRLRRRRSAVVDSLWLSGPWSPGLIRAVRRSSLTSDVVIGVSAPSATILLPVLLRRAGGARVVAMPLLHLASSDVHPAVLRALRRCDQVVAVTEFEAEADRSFGVAADRVAVIPPGVSCAEFPPMDATEARQRCGLPERLTVGFVGRLAAYKGIDTLLEAAPLLWAEHPDVTVVVAGSPGGWAGYRTAVSPEQSKERLVIREGFADSERATLLSACDVVVHPSREESFGLIAVESWAAQRAVVLGDIPSVRSFVRRGETGELVEPGDAAGLAAVLGELIDDPVRRLRLARAGYQEVRERFEWEPIIDTWADTLAQLTDGSR